MHRGLLRDAGSGALMITLAQGPTTLAQELLARAPIGYWRESDGVDHSGNALNLTPFGSPTAPASLDASDATNAAIGLTAGKNLWNPGASAAFSLGAQVSLFALINPSTVGDVTRDVTGKGFSYGIRTQADGKLHAYVRRAGDGGETGAVSTTTISAGVRHAVGMSFDGTTLRLFVDGALEASTVHAEAIGLVATSFTIGESGVAASGYAGTIDEVALFDTRIADQDFAVFSARGLG